MTEVAVKTEQILLVDDDRLILSVLSHSLQQSGYTIKTAEDGQSAIKMCIQRPPDLVVLDMNMPDINGVDVAKWLRQNSQIPFIFLSAYSEEYIVAQAVKEGALGYLIKPIEPTQFLVAVHAALARSRELQELKNTSEQLNKALSGERVVNTALGILINRDHLTENQALDKLRQYARSNRRKLTDVARELVNASETLNKILA